MNDIIKLRDIPQELKMSALWCAWKLESNGKVPYNLANGQHAKSNDATTFNSYPVLLQNIHKYLIEDADGKQLGGIGLGIFRGFSAIDIDHCVSDGVINDMAQEIIDYCKSYTELSPSKTGIRIIFKTDVKINKDEYYINNRNNGLEIYISDNTSKFVTITGNKISGDIINNVNIKPILEKYMRKSNNNTDITKYFDKDDKLKELWFTQAPGSNSNESELDMALCCKLAYYLKNDAIEIEKWFKKSPFYESKDAKHKKKWETQDYINRTIRGAIGFIDIPQPQQTNAISKRKYELNDTGNAHRFIEQFGDILRYNVDNDKWMIYNGTFWQTDIKGKVKDYVEILAEQMLFESNNETDLNTRTRILHNIDRVYNSSGKEALLKEARHIGDIPIMNEDLDRNPFLLCTNSGTINLENGEIQPNNKDDMISMCTGCDIDLINEPKRFIKFINEIFENDQDVINYIQKALGYSMTNSTREQCMFILHGDGNNGKSLLLDVIYKALGGYSITCKPQMLTENKYATTNSEEIARTKGKRFVAVEEIKEGDKLDEQLVKSLTSGMGNQVARFLYGNSFEFAFTGKLWMATNYEPVIRGTDKGIWRRIVKIPVNVDFTGREDRDLRNKLLDELPQILGWIFKGFKMYQTDGLGKPPKVIDAIEEYKADMDIVQQWINEYCECGNQYYERANVLYDNFRAYVIRRDQKTNQTIFGRNLSKKFRKKVYNGCITYIGVRLKQGKDDIGKKVRFDEIKVREDI